MPKLREPRAPPVRVDGPKGNESFVVGHVLTQRNPPPPPPPPMPKPPYPRPRTIQIQRADDPVAPTPPPPEPHDPDPVRGGSHIIGVRGAAPSP
ncbi:hypothetical protein DFH09DRAFT_1329895 [Mycena vulgaris]|nr:hypothetical protein DFH09DRAFT_1329895 [Mycena vulgaris]